VDFLARFRSGGGGASELRKSGYAELNPYFFTLQTLKTVFTSNQLRAQRLSL